MEIFPLDKVDSLKFNLTFSLCCASVLEFKEFIRHPLQWQGVAVIILYVPKKCRWPRIRNTPASLARAIAEKLCRIVSMRYFRACQKIISKIPQPQPLFPTHVVKCSPSFRHQLLKWILSKTRIVVINVSHGTDEIGPITKAVVSLSNVWCGNHSLIMCQ